MKCLSALLGAGGLAAGDCEEPKQTPKQNLKNHAMHKNKGHGTRSRLQGIAVHQQISRTQVGLLCRRKCRVKELLEVAKGSIKDLLQPTGHNHFYHEHGSTRTATVRNNRSHTRLVDVHQALGLSRIQPKAFHTNGEMAMIALDLMGHALRAKVIDRFILNCLVILLSLNKCQGAIIESGSPLSIMFQALHIRGYMETATYIKGSQIGCQLNANQRCKWNSRSS